MSNELLKSKIEQLKKLGQTMNDMKEKGQSAQDVEQAEVISLDEVDKLRLDNLMLRKALRKYDEQEDFNNFYKILAVKYQVDRNRFSIDVDQSQGVFSIKTK